MDIGSPGRSAPAFWPRGPRSGVPGPDPWWCWHHCPEAASGQDGARERLHPRPGPELPRRAASGSPGTPPSRCSGSSRSSSASCCSWSAGCWWWSWVGILLRRCGDPADPRWSPTGSARSPAGCSAPSCRRRTSRSRAVGRWSGSRLGARRPDDLARPGLDPVGDHRRLGDLAGRDRAAARAVVTGVLLVVRRSSRCCGCGPRWTGRCSPTAAPRRWSGGSQALTQSRAEAVDHSAAELRRIERDLHDGTQARLVAVSMSLGMAEELFETRPRGGPADGQRGPRRHLARRSPTCARWCAASTRRCSPTAASTVRSRRWPSTWRSRSRSSASWPAGRPRPIESAVYFAVAECLANSAKHAGHQHAWVELTHDDGRAPRRGRRRRPRRRGPGSPGTGMRGVMRRLAAFDGTMAVSSPDGGPTIVTLEVPCVLSSPRTTPSSATA